VPLKSCTVTFRDLDGTGHSVDVSAETLMEAAGLALQAFRQAPFIDPDPGPASRLEVEVKSPTVRHTVTVQQVYKWMESGSTDPRDGTKKKRIAEALQLAPVPPAAPPGRR
jgi:hypothetical protein